MNRLKYWIMILMIFSLSESSAQSTYTTPDERVTITVPPSLGEAASPETLAQLSGGAFKALAAFRNSEGVSLLVGWAPNALKTPVPVKEMFVNLKSDAERHLPLSKWLAHEIISVSRMECILLNCEIIQQGITFEQAQLFIPLLPDQIQIIMTRPVAAASVTHEDFLEIIKTCKLKALTEPVR
jgi:hypothetical protein